MTGRRRVALGPPPVDLDGFPRARRPRAMFRAHAAARGPWWYSSDGSGRFDLSAPRGTCYLAGDPAAALRERLGPTLAGLGFVRDVDVDGVVISRLRPPAGRPLADTASESAVRFRMTREIATTIDYGVTQRWSAALLTAGFDGVRYQPRFSTGATTFSYALFGAAGAGDGQFDPCAQTAREVAERSGIRVESDPGLAGLTVVSPSGT